MSHLFLLLLTAQPMSVAGDGLPVVFVECQELHQSVSSLADDAFVYRVSYAITDEGHRGCDDPATTRLTSGSTILPQETWNAEVDRPLKFPSWVGCSLPVREVPVLELEPRARTGT